MNGVKLLQQLPGVKIEQLQSKGHQYPPRQHQERDQYQLRDQLYPHPKEHPPNVTTKTGNAARNFKKHADKVFAQTWQKEILFGYFKKNPYPGKEETAEITQKTGLGPEWQKCWFHYQRRKIRWKHDGKTTYFRPQQQQQQRPNKPENLKNEEVEPRTKIDNHDAYMLENNATDILEKAELLKDMKEKFEALNAKYQMLSDLIFEKSILTMDDLDKEPEGEKIMKEDASDASRSSVESPEGIYDSSKDESVPQEPPKEVQQTNNFQAYPPPPYHPYYPPYYPPPPPGYLPYPPYQHPPQYYPGYPPANQPAPYPNQQKFPQQ